MNSTFHLQEEAAKHYFLFLKLWRLTHFQSYIIEVEYLQLSEGQNETSQASWATKFCFLAFFG